MTDTERQLTANEPAFDKVPPGHIYTIRFMPGGGEDGEGRPFAAGAVAVLGQIGATGSSRRWFHPGCHWHDWPDGDWRPNKCAPTEQEIVRMHWQAAVKDLQPQPGPPGVGFWPADLTDGWVVIGRTGLASRAIIAAIHLNSGELNPITGMRIDKECIAVRLVTQDILYYTGDDMINQARKALRAAGLDLPGADTGGFGQ